MIAWKRLVYESDFIDFFEIRLFSFPTFRIRVILISINLLSL